MEWAGFQKIVEILFPRSSNLDFVFEASQIKYTIEKTTYVYTLQEFDATISNLSLYTKNPTYIYKSSELEVLIDPLEPRAGARFQDESLNISDDTVSYKIASPSPELILAILSSIPEEDIRNYRRLLPSRFFLQRYNESEAGDIKLFDLILRVMRVSLSLKISSVTNMPFSILQRYANSFLFNLSYNTSTVFKLTLDISELSFSRERIAPRRFLRVEEMGTPKLFYTNELTEQYNLALSSSDPFIKFIAYYHIMEYFFDDVYNGALISSVKEVLLHPGFSAKKPKEINKIIDIVRRKTKITKEEFQGTELEALELTIKTFISMEQLHTSLYEYEPKLINYYKTHEVSFSNGDAVDLSDFSNERLPKKIAARIYKTRNSLVHSKSNNSKIKERGIYRPFTDDKELTSEIPLMKLIAEAIIIKSAEEI
jgi:hypothetical protein